ncbi:MAG: 30S ribosomal protein S4 [Patescibacteria group bacterium]|nr:30S ribosomal protein S4 [Patescibacteria group bacterium]
MKIGPREKYCRRYGQKLLWNDRCSSVKCGLVRRRNRPGVHGKKPRPLSLYARQLIEKQKLRFSYLLSEKKMKNYVQMAMKFKESAPLALIELLERRLDNVIWRAGYVTSKLMARQLVSHGHFLVNGSKMKSASYLVKEGDIISIKPQSRNIKPFSDLGQRLKFYQPPHWIVFDPKTFESKIVKLPKSEEVQHNFNLSLVIDFYSR